MRPSLRQIDAFLAVAELGSFSRAAERLGSTQPAISQSVRELEEALALRLFDRTTRRVELTAAGAALREQVAEGIDALDRAFARARDLATLKRGHLRIAAPPLMAATVLPPLLASFAAAHPGLTFEIADVITTEIVARLRAGQADLGLGTFAMDEPDLERRLVLRDAMMLYLPRDHALASDSPAAWSDLAGQPMVALERSSGLRRLMETGFDAAAIPVRLAFEVQQVNTALALVEAGLGLAVLPGYAAVAAKGRALTSRPLVMPQISREVVLLQPRDRRAPPVAAAFAEHLSRHLRRAYPHP